MKYLVFLLILLFPLEIVIGQQFNAFLFTKTDGWHHESIREGVTAIENLGKKNHFNVDWNEREELFTDESLEKYDVIIFLNTTLNILNEDQQKAMENFIRSGKGYVGIMRLQIRNMTGPGTGSWLEECLWYIPQFRRQS